MSSLDIEIKVDGDAVAVQRIRAALSNRAPLHKALASTHEDFTRDYVSKLNRHKTARRLGATPTQHHKKAAQGIEGDSDADAAYLRIPRASGLGRAYYDVEIVPGGGKKFLTLPNDALTYGKRAGEFGADAFRFVSYAGRHFALVWKDGPKKGDVAYWLKKKVNLDQDRTLLPSDEVMIKLSSKVISKYIRFIAGEKGSPSSDSFPSA